jgi:membrane-bound serine protease (ClpP class)
VSSPDPTLAFVLFVIGLAGLVFEIFHPGLRLPGIVGLVSFVVSLILFGNLPVRATGVVLLVAAFVLFAVEIKAPARGFASVAGTACLVLGGLYLYRPHTLRVSIPLLIGLAVALGAFFLVVARAAWNAQSAPIVSGTEALLGEFAVVTEPLDPVGQVRVRGENWAAKVYNGTSATIPVGAKVVVWATEGLTLLVEPAPSTQDEPHTT